MFLLSVGREGEGGGKKRRKRQASSGALFLRAEAGVIRARPVGPPQLQGRRKGKEREREGKGSSRRDLLLIFPLKRSA